MTVIIMLQGVGRTLPGFVHGLLFCVLTKEVRTTMMKGIWSGITNCEVCIYDYSCGVSWCRRKRNNPGNFLSDQSTCAEEIPDPTNTEQSKALLDTLSEYDIVSSPDPTASVLIVQIPQVSAHDTEQDNSASGDVYSYS